MTTTAQTSRPTPPHDDTPAQGYGSWVPHDLPYNADFEDSLIPAVLDSNRSSSGIRVIPEDSSEAPVPGQSVRIQDIDLTTLPNLTESSLPIPLSDPRRIYASSIPGINLTHPYGWTEGGPSLDPNLDTFADDFLLNHPDVSNEAQLRAAVDHEVQEHLEVVKERLRARQKAKERNEQIQKEIKTLTDQHDMELRIQQRMQEDQRRKKEAREKKRVERDGGG
ncbi:uncharacterized protein LTR77_008881 [Saxophila tyrrhenica]|uniref:Uncharacterized protein n=1 Tax=Saxophila tyrrhenica TaxID=1690608 RepID=A0AAV9P1A8_9PEZI|nr:hypothetical protein LTR77_008881 [Saxophila tyrrhenica]